MSNAVRPLASTALSSSRHEDVYKRQVYNTWAHTYVLDAMSMRAARLDRNSPRYRELKSCAGCLLYTSEWYARHR